MLSACVLDRHLEPAADGPVRRHESRESSAVLRGAGSSLQRATGVSQPATGVFQPAAGVSRLASDRTAAILLSTSATGRGAAQGSLSRATQDCGASRAAEACGSASCGAEDCGSAKGDTATGRASAARARAQDCAFAENGIDGGHSGSTTAAAAVNAASSGDASRNNRRTGCSARSRRACREPWAVPRPPVRARRSRPDCFGVVLVPIERRTRPPGLLARGEHGICSSLERCSHFTSADSSVTRRRARRHDTTAGARAGCAISSSGCGRPGSTASNHSSSSGQRGQRAGVPQPDAQRRLDVLTRKRCAG